MKRADPVRIADILGAAQLISSFLHGVSHAKFMDNDEKKGAVVYQLIIIGQAANGLSNEFRSTHSSLPWKRIIGMRNIATHAYFDVNYEIVWKAARERVPELARYLRAIKI